MNPPHVHKLSTFCVFALLLIGVTFLKRTNIHREERHTALRNKSLDLKPYLVFKQIDKKSRGTVDLNAISIKALSIK